MWGSSPWGMELGIDYSVQAPVVGTTSTAIRQAIIDLVTAKVATQRSGDRFRLHRDEVGFDAWIESNPQACFRVFEVADLYDYESPAVTNTDFEWLETTFLVRVAYPMSMATNADDGMRDIRDWVDEDLRLLDAVVGINGYANYSSGSVITSRPAINEQPPVYIGEIEIRFGFYRSV